MLKSPIETPDISSDHLKELFIYWQKIRADKSMPRRQDFSPADVPHLLPYISLVNVEYGNDTEHTQQRYCCRLLGTETVKALGKDVTGKYLDEVPEVSVLKERFDWLVENKTPYFIRGQLVWSQKSFLNYEAVGLPLSNNDSEVNIIMYGTCYQFPQDQKSPTFGVYPQ
ncbi:PAS domain-containing protein [Emcibacter sp.]|uniref:PAS domain-containing protein n=1 Tax=Emcibacter sp. TaxID=1979954 RepID=UPI002AA6724E|nr:PAS domain-containing protein [Emcibacter sp.]